MIKREDVAGAIASRLSSSHFESSIISWGSEDMQDDGPLRGVRVLVVEDTWQVAMALKSTLTDAGVVVLGPAGTVAEAERLVAEEAPDLVLVDLNLHGEMVFDLVDRLRQREVRVIVDPDRCDDATSRLIARDVAKRIQAEMTYPGEIRVTVLREVRAVDFAR